MILEFSISNFGPINEEQTLSFEATSDDTLDEYYVEIMPDDVRVLKLGMIYGPNASGKSTVLKALEFLSQLVTEPKSQKDEQWDFEKHLIGDHSNEPAIFKLIFYLNGVRFNYELSVHHDHVCYEKLSYIPKGRTAILFERTTEERITKISYGSTLSLKASEKEQLRIKSLLNNTVLSAYSQLNIKVTELDDVYNWFHAQLLPVVHPKTELYKYTIDQIREKQLDKEQVLQFLQKADLNITDIEIEDRKLEYSEELEEALRSQGVSNTILQQLRDEGGFDAFMARLKHSYGDVNKNVSFSLDSESDGTRRYLGLAGPVFTCIKRKAFLYIDELESSLHHELQKHLITSFLKEARRAQLLFTTHNIALLRERQLLRNDAVWFTEKNDQGATELYSVADFGTEQVRNDAILFNKYMSGSLGARPSPDFVNE